MKQKISVTELSEGLRQGRQIKLVDVRSADEYASGHAAQAINVPLEQLEARLDDLGDQTIALLCQSGRRAEMACDVLDEHHHSLLIVEGGTQAWEREGKPMVRASSSRWSLERQVRLAAGLIVLTASALALTVDIKWLFLSAFVGAGLTIAGLTNFCGMGLLFSKLPWNQPRRSGRMVQEAHS
ncbi:MAG: DUF2892 domain-containing protein [Armatimonadetes bacterium]|nr:DUF2892 domain-containing protein [Armatimonadota bacterium]